MTPYAALLQRVRRDPAQPLVTYVRPASGERMELSTTSLLNAVAKTAGLLRDDLDIEPGDRVGVRLPLHWQRAVWWAACGAVGAVYCPDATERVTVVSRATLDDATAAQDIVLVSLAPFGLPDGEPVPSPIVEAAVAARAHPDQFEPYDVPGDDWPAMASGTGDLTHESVWQRSVALATERGLNSGDRFAIRADDPDAHLMQLAVPLAIGGSVLLIDGADGALDDTLRAEGAIRGWRTR